MHRCETDVRATTLAPVPPALISVNLAYYIEIPRRDTERFGRMSECASAVIRFVFAVAIAGENHFFPHPDSAKVLFHWENLKYSALSAGQVASRDARGGEQDGRQLCISFYFS